PGRCGRVQGLGSGVAAGLGRLVQAVNRGTGHGAGPAPGPNHSGSLQMSMQAALARVIDAIGEAEFPAVAAGSVGHLLGFDLAAIIVHPRGWPPSLLFDNFDLLDGRSGIETYLRVTHAFSPILARKPVQRAFRARDFAIRRPASGVASQLLPAPEEE